MATGKDTTLEADGREVRLSHPDKVLYPNAREGDAATKREIAEYYRAVAPALLTHAADRPATRMRWPDGTEGEMFVEKNLPQGAPDWLTTVALEHSRRTAHYPVLDSAAALVWCAQMGALELHVPQWTLEGPAGDRSPGKTRRLVVDLDPGPEIDLDHTARIALRVRDLLADAGLDSWPVTSGSKGIHVYARLPRAVTSQSASRLARTVAKGLAEQTPDLVTAAMKKSERSGRVFVDWSQNNASKTTVAPYSLRARDRPFVAAPRTWDELGDGGLEQLTAAEVLERLASDGDLLADLAPARQRHADADEPLAETVDLTAYRRKRDRQKTPEPFGDAPREAGDPIFVIQKHDARRLHYDVRLERDGVLVSWAVPKNLPPETGIRRLAVRTEDHPMDYADFEGRIPKGEYGAGTVEIWDRGTIEVEKWRSDEVLVAMRGDRVDGRFAFVRIEEGEADNTRSQWIVQKRDEDAGAGKAGEGDDDEAGPPPDGERDAGRADLPDALRDPRPMLPTDREVGRLTAAAWAFELKWDGYRALVGVVGGEVRITSRGGHDLTDRVPGLEALPGELGVDAVLDAELVALGEDGRARFGALAAREAGGEDVPVSLVVFDALWVDGTSLLRTRWERRREVLDELAPRLRRLDPVIVPEVLEADSGAEALDLAREQGAEGVVAKKRDSSYRPGRRTTGWVKEKFWTSTEVVVGGWRPGRSGSRGLGSLLVGVPDGDRLAYLGRVGSGLTGAVADELADELDGLARKRSPFRGELGRDVTRDARWVLPRIVVEVRHHGLTDHGHLRHPSLRGIRRDKLPGDLTTGS